MAMNGKMALGGSSNGHDGGGGDRSLCGLTNGNNMVAINDDLMEVIEDDLQPIKLKPVIHVFIGKLKYKVSCVDFRMDRIQLCNLTTPNGKFNITLPYKEVDTLRYHFDPSENIDERLCLIVLEPIYDSYVKLSNFSNQYKAVTVPENFIMIQTRGRLSDREMERIRRWATEESNKIKFSSISKVFAHTYLQTPNRANGNSGSLTGRPSITQQKPQILRARQTTMGTVSQATSQSGNFKVSTVRRSTANSFANSKPKHDVIEIDSDPEDCPGGSTGGAGQLGSAPPPKQRLLDKIILKYPPNDKNQISLYGRDLLCIRDGQYLSDNIVNFYLKYHLYNGPVAQSLKDKVFIYDALFATLLITKKPKKQPPVQHNNFLVYRVETLKDTYHKSLKQWTKKVDIFTKDYLFIPFIRDQHWFLVILCNIYNIRPRYLNKPLPEKKASIIFMDSLNKHSMLDVSPTSNTSVILHYLECEYRNKYGVPENVTSEKASESVVSESVVSESVVSECENDPNENDPSEDDLWESDPSKREAKEAAKLPKFFCNFEILAPKVPQQTNFYDCGLFALEYVERFLANPEAVLGSLKKDANTLAKWFTPRDLKMKRSTIRQTIINLIPPDDVKPLEEELDELQKSSGGPPPPSMDFEEETLFDN